MNTLLLLISVLCSSLAQILLKAGVQGIASSGLSPLAFLIQCAVSPRVVGGVALHVGALGFWLVALRQVDVSYAYPFISLGFVLVFVVSSLWLGETVPPLRMLGLALVIGGIIVIART